MSIEEKIKEYGLVPVVVINRVEDALPLAKALVEGGLPVAEVTFRTKAAKDAIKAMSKEYPDMLIGAGTVLTTTQVDEAINAGAKFIVSPGFDGEVVDYCLAKNVPVMPGIVTPSELMMAIKKGLNIVKFFPAEISGGVAAIKNLAAVFPGVSFMPTGGINEKNLADYLACNKVIACGGTWMVNGKLIDAGDFETIKAKTKEAVTLVDKIRNV